MESISLHRYLWFVRNRGVMNTHIVAVDVIIGSGFVISVELACFVQLFGKEYEHI